MIHLVGPGGAGKTTTGALLAARLGLRFIDLDKWFLATVDGGIGGFIRERGYRAYAARNVELYSKLVRAVPQSSVVALSSGFMTYPLDVHPEYGTYREKIAISPTTVVLLPSLAYEACVAEIVRRQLKRLFARSAAREREVIRERFWVYSGLPARKVETRCHPEAVVAEISAGLPARLEPEAEAKPEACA